MGGEETHDDAATLVSIDVVEDSLYVGEALQDLVAARQSPLWVNRVESSWIRYIESFDEAAGIVIVQAELQDHVPTLLKVRALAAIDSIPIVLANQPDNQHIARLHNAGAAAVLTAGNSFDDLLTILLSAGSTPPMSKRVPCAPCCAGSAR